MAFDYGTAFGLAGDILSGIGDYQAGRAAASASSGNAKTARENAARARANADLSGRGNALQLMRLRQSASMQLGGQATDVAASGLTEGSALDVVRQSQRNAALDAVLLRQQGQINVSGFETQAASFEGQAQAYDAEAKAAKKKSSGGFFGSIGKVLGGVAGFALGGPGGAAVGAGFGGAIGGLF